MIKFGLTRRIGYNGANVQTIEQVVGRSFRLLSSTQNLQDNPEPSFTRVMFYNTKEDSGYVTELVSGDVFSMPRGEFFDRVEVLPCVPVAIGGTPTLRSYLFDVSVDDVMPSLHERVLRARRDLGVSANQLIPDASYPVFNKFLTRIVGNFAVTFVANGSVEVSTNIGMLNVVLWRNDFTASGNFSFDIPLNFACNSVNSGFVVAMTINGGSTGDITHVIHGY